MVEFDEDSKVGQNHVGFVLCCDSELRLSDQRGSEIPKTVQVT